MLQDNYLPPKTGSIVKKDSNFNYLCKIDLKSVYDQIWFHPKHKPYTAFQVSKKIYEWKVLLFGVTNALF